jgi:hypothetical protein
MPLEGCQLNVKQALSLCYAVGFRGRGLITAVAVMGAESGRFTGAYHDNDDLYESVDRGLFQINDHWHPNFPIADAFNAVPNARYAYKMSDGGRHWNPWAAYYNGTYLVNVPKVTAVLALSKLGLWTKSIEDRASDLLAAGDDWNPCR